MQQGIWLINYLENMGMLTRINIIDLTDIINRAVLCDCITPTDLIIFFDLANIIHIIGFTAPTHVVAHLINWNKPTCQKHLHTKHDIQELDEQGRNVNILLMFATLLGPSVCLLLMWLW